MTRHLTVRMAWHDNNWNGRVCTDPDGNVYCVGNHSLLSERIARERRTTLEQQHAGERIDKLPQDYIPPCYYTTNAFSSLSLKVVHKHPFRGAKSDEIKDSLPSYSVFTWPFRLSFNHGKGKKKLEGDYPPDLENRIHRFRAKFTPDESLVFFYLNYDNPVSADEVTRQGYYVLVGCATVKDVRHAKHFSLDPAWEANLKKRQWPKYKNFPTVNWAFSVLYDFERTGILLPYKEYLERAQKFPEEQIKLEKMRVLIEEEALLPHFKYVATDMNDDAAIYLLYKLHKALIVTEDDAITDASQQLKRCKQLLRKAWRNRGLYPSLGRILDVTYDADNKEFYGKAEEFVAQVKKNLGRDEDLLERTFEILRAKTTPAYLSPYKSWVAALRKSLDDVLDRIDLLKKLALFNLTHYQINRILNNREEAFNRHVSSQEIARNPYLLAEEYVPKEFSPGEDRDQEELPDGEIGLFTIDIGMHPDPNYVGETSNLQDLSPGSAERIRAITIEYLEWRGDQGDCFVNLDDLYDYIVEYPIFYKSTLNVEKSKLAAPREHFKDHLEERIFIDAKSKTGPYFYLKEARVAEELVAKTVEELLKRADYDFDVPAVNQFNEKEARVLEKEIEAFDSLRFLEERNALLHSVFKRPFYIISGRPGSGKTKALGKIVSEILKRNERVTLLAPTGKASLRLREEVQGLRDAEPQTIDRFVYATDFRKCFESFENLLFLRDELRPKIQNLIIDECSMVDLQRLATLFEMLWKSPEHKSLSVKRVILVGDENQLPPIGFGRPFYDIIQRIKDDKKYRNANYIQLRTNCRSNFDPNIMRLAEIYESKNRYYEERLQKLISGGRVSKGLTVALWKSNSELRTLITSSIDNLLPVSKKSSTLSPEDRIRGFYLLLGLYEQGYVKWNKENGGWAMELENFQILSPYRGEGFGTLGLNDHVKGTYNPSRVAGYGNVKRFDHGDKMIRLNNWYAWDRSAGGRTLRLSNGSIGVACDNKAPLGRQYYFPETGRLGHIDDPDNFEHAYAITVHKAQGSEFEHVFLVLPRKRSLLTKELIYTALTRSRQDLLLLLQESDGKSPLEEARERSAILSRNTSLFEPPEDIKGKLWPAKEVPVKSKIEYILYKHLDEAQKAGVLKFKYEEDLHLQTTGITIHPDFTVRIGSRTYFWEHLGELDLKQYSGDWKRRRDDYRANGLIDNVITTDDLGGVRDELIQTVIDDLSAGKLRPTEGSFSEHHYQLYL